MGVAAGSQDPTPPWEGSHDKGSGWDPSDGDGGDGQQPSDDENDFPSDLRTHAHDITLASSIVVIVAFALLTARISASSALASTY